uniref:Nucleoside diphosphate kinase homolog 5 n=1 Tax=Strigamia maritima TaxID=126957 RepID=T1IS50_STRMM
MTVPVEKTLALLKPGSVQFFDQVEEVIKEHGFTILQKRKLQLTSEQLSEFYGEHFGKPFFHDLIAYMRSGPVIAMVLARQQAVVQWRILIGPTKTSNARIVAPNSLRARFGIDDTRNGFHGSDSLPSAEREIHFFFPGTIVEPVMSGQAAKDYLAQAVNPTLLKGLTHLCKNKPNDPIIWLADWLLINNPNKPIIEDVTNLYDLPDFN